MTSVKESEHDVIKLADRSYAPYNFSGKGYKILRKNIKQVSLAVTTIVVSAVPTSDGYMSFIINGVESHVDVVASSDTTTDKVAEKIAAKLSATMTEYEVSKDTSTITLTRKFGGSVTPSIFSASTTGVVCTITDSTKNEFKNILTPVMINQPNTIYEIRYDFDLNGETIEMQEGCTLKFNGGYFRNGTLKGGGTNISACKTCIFKNINIEGTWHIADIYSVWFLENNSTLLFRNLCTLLNSQIHNNLYIDGNYKVKLQKEYDYALAPCSNTDIYISGEISQAPDSLEHTYIIKVSGENIHIHGGTLRGNVQEHIGTTGEWEYGVSFIDAKNCSIRETDIGYFFGDSINIDGYTMNAPCSNITVSSCRIHSDRRVGLSIEHCENSLIDNCLFYDIGKYSPTAPFAAMDIEPYGDRICRNITIRNCQAIDCNYSFKVYSNDNNTDNITFSHCSSNSGTALRITGTVKFENCKIEIIMNVVGDSKGELFLTNCTFGIVNIYNLKAVLKDCHFSSLLTNKTFADAYHSSLLYIEEGGNVNVYNSTFDINRKEKLSLNPIDCSKDTHVNVYNSILNISKEDAAFYIRYNLYNSIIYSAFLYLENVNNNSALELYNNTFFQSDNSYQLFNLTRNEENIGSEIPLFKIVNNLIDSGHVPYIGKSTFYDGNFNNSKIVVAQNTNIGTTFYPYYLGIERQRLLDIGFEEPTFIENMLNCHPYIYDGKTKPLYYQQGTQAFNTETERLQIWDGERWLSNGELATVSHAGSFLNKPEPRHSGFQYFNTDTHKTITWDGSKWWNPDGTEATQ